MLEIRHLRLVRALAEEGGPTKAAARLHLTQSAVSHQLADLEGRLGVQLFTRVRRQLKLTRAGERLLEGARSMLGDLTRLEQELYRAGKGIEKRTVLRVVTECFTSYHWLPRVVVAVRRKHPHLDVRIVLESAREPVAALLRGELDAAIVSTPIRDPQLVAMRLFEDEWTLILAPSHRLAKRPFITARELAEETLYTHDAPRSDVARLREILAEERAAMPRAEKVPLTDALVDLVRAGLGVGLVSRWAVAPYAKRKEIVCRRFTRDGLPETWSLVYRRDTEHRLPVADFAECVAKLGLLEP